jgi:HD-like signal output (HDOD) protein
MTPSASNTAVQAMPKGMAADRAFQRILSSIKQLPSPSEVCLAVTRASEAEQTTLAELQSLVENDIALSGRLMQVANSSFFGIRDQVTSVRRAISLLGFATVRTLALGFFFNEEFGKLRLPGLPYPTLPHFALASSVLAEAIAEQQAPARMAEAACLGLLHESGVIIMAMTFGGRYRAMLRQSASGSFELALMERRTFGFDHAMAGKLLFESWRLGPDLTAAVANHHQLDADSNLPPSCVTLWRVLLLADSLALPLLQCQMRGPAVQGPAQTAAQEEESVLLAQRLFAWPGEKCAEVLQSARTKYQQRLAILGGPRTEGEGCRSDGDPAETTG